MAGRSLTKRTTGTDLVYEAVDANLEGSRMVIPSTTPTVSGLQGITVAGNTAKNALGASATYAVTEANRAAAENTTDSAGFPVLNVGGVANATVTVYNQFTGLLEYTAAAVAYGDKLACAADGKVRKWVTADDADAIIGFCAEPGGVSSAGGWALARIDL